MEMLLLSMHDSFFFFFFFCVWRRTPAPGLRYLMGLWMWACASVLSCLVVSHSLWPHRLQPTRLLCPWDSPGENTGVRCHALLQGIFPTQGSNPHLLHLQPLQADSLPPNHLGSPRSPCSSSQNRGWGQGPPWNSPGMPPYSSWYLLLNRGRL